MKNRNIIKCFRFILEFDTKKEFYKQCRAETLKVVAFEYSIFWLLALRVFRPIINIVNSLKILKKPKDSVLLDDAIPVGCARYQYAR